MTDNLDLTLSRGLLLATADGSDDLETIQALATRISSLATEHSSFAEWCRRADELYYATTFTTWGADLWPDDPSVKEEGRTHISVNTPAAYVDIPAHLQAVEPIENMLATDDTASARHAASALERVYKAWKAEEKFELKFHKAAVIKSLYGKTAGYVYWNPDESRPCVSIVQNPRNLYLGYRSDDYEEVEWAGYVERLDPNEVVARYGVEFGVRAMPGDPLGTVGAIPYIVTSGEPANQPRPTFNFGPARVEVWDYWYRKADGPIRKGKRTKMVTYNVVVAGNAVVRGPFAYPEYEGVIPYVPVFNTFIPGIPTGRAELHDMEHLIREKMESITSGAQAIAGATAGNYWQLTGPDAPSRVPANAKPRLNEVAAPGAGNRIEAISPFIAQFQLETYLGRIDREMAVVSGLNDLLLGLAPAQVLSSSKAINALISNYESRLSMRRLLFYTWRRDMWSLCVKVWAKKDRKNIGEIMLAGGGTLEITDPSLSPRDEMETAQRAINLVNNKLWSQARGMDVTGVDDPEQEQNIIRAERTDATMFPADVQTMAQLLSVLSSLGLNAPAADQQGQQTVEKTQSDLRNALGGAPGTNATQGAGEQQITPPEAQVPGATPAGPAQPLVSGPAMQPATASVQTMLQGGHSTGRILTQQKLGRR